MMRLETAAGCMRTPEVAMALDELGLAFEVKRMPDGFLMATHGRMGPRLVDGMLEIFEPWAIVRHLARLAPSSERSPQSPAEWAEVDQWHDLAASQLRPSAGRIARMSMGGRGDDPMVQKEREALGSILALLEKRLRASDWLLGRFTVADCAFVGLGMMEMIGVELERFEAVAAYRTRLLQRPSWERAMKRAQGHSGTGSA